jgi:MraZ protein
MFQGEYEHTLDDKNRVVLPAGMRKGTAEQTLQFGFTLAIGRRARCLELHPMQEWTKKIERLQGSYTEDNEEAEEYLRDLLASANEILLDRQYRFVLPDARKKDAGIEKEVVFIGMWNRIEIWDKTRWEERRRQREGKQAPPPLQGPARPPGNGAPPGQSGVVDG